MIDNQLVSIVIPCCNNESTIIDTIQSIQKQSYTQIEIIIIDDGSIDDTYNIVSSYVSQHSGIVFKKQLNQGQSVARNIGLEIAKGEFVVFVDADDLLAHNYLEECLTIFSKQPELLMVYSNMYVFERENSVFKLDDFNILKFLLKNCIPIYAMMRTKKLKEVGGFDSQLRNHEDWECWIRMIKTYGPFIFKINEPLYYYRKRLNRDSITDISVNKLAEENSFFYIYIKHYEFYAHHNITIMNLFDNLYQGEKFRKKYYNVWYRKLLYKVLNPRKYNEIYGNINN